MKRMYAIIVLLILCQIFFMYGCNDNTQDAIDGDLDTSELDQNEAASDGDTELDNKTEAEPDEEKPVRPEYPKDDLIRINQIQVKGTHNSYHIATDTTPLPQLEYTHASLDIQLEEQGVRQFEIDVTYAEGKGFIVIHDELFDPGTTCEYFNECMQLMKDWSDENPGHHLLFILIEPKDDNAEEKFSNQALEAEMLEVWGRDRILTPDDVRGEKDNLRDAILQNGWPTLGATRDKAMFILFDSGEHRTMQLDGHSNLADRVMFIRSGSPSAESDWTKIEDINAAFFKLDHPVDDAQKIEKAIEAGFIVRTRADANVYEARNEDYSRQEEALKSGSQMISTDFPEKTEEFDYMFTIEDGNPSRCNPVNAPNDCTAEDVENLP